MMRILLLILCLPIGLPAQATFTKVADPNNDLTQQAPIPVYNGVSWLDFDNDGWEDCFVSSNNLYRNRQDGTFERVDFSPINPGLGNGNAWADYDGDGDLDVVIAASPTRLYRNDAGTFVATPILAEPLDVFNYWSASWGDYDGDGWLDLALLHPTGFLPTFNNPIAQPSLVLKNDQTGTFTIVDTPLDDELAAHTIGTWTDYDLDNDLDLFVGSGEVSAPSLDHIYVNQLTETGTPELIRLTTTALATDLRDGQNWNLIDYDLDGDLDAFVTNYLSSKRNDLYRNDAGTYVRQTEESAGSIADQTGRGLNNIWVDFDNDGYQDCFVIFDGGGTDRYYHNLGDGTFTEQEQVFTKPTRARGAAAGDYDQDGFMDLMVSAVDAGDVGLYRNATDNDNNWVHLRLRGTAPNTAAIGAKVRLKATIGDSPKWQIREINTQNTFNGHNSLRLHFGLGQAGMIDSLEVIWPDGSRETATEILPNQLCDWTAGTAIDCNFFVAADDPVVEPTSVNVFPNPGPAAQLRVRYQLPGRDSVRWSVYDTNGRHLSNLGGTLPPAATEARLPVAGLPAGSYVLLLERAGERQRTVFVVTE